MKVTLTGLSINRRMSEETTCFTATIVVDGKTAGTVMNRGNGGCNIYYWSDRAAGKKVEAFAEKQKTEFNFEKLDQFIDGIRIDIEVEKQLKGWMKRKVHFRLKGDQRGQWRSVGALGKEATDYIVKKYGKRVELILSPANLKQAIKL